MDKCDVCGKTVDAEDGYSVFDEHDGWRLCEDCEPPVPHVEGKQ